MITTLHNLISQKGFHLEPKEPFVVTVPDETQGISLAKDILYQSADKKTLLLLSGGRTPQAFYKDLAHEERLDSGAAGLIDERFGQTLHEQSNERLLYESGLLSYFSYKKIPFHSVLQKEKNITETAGQYDETLRFLFNGFQKSIGILGIGLDGHTAGIPSAHQESPDEKNLFATYFTDFPGPQKERISMTFLGLSQLDVLLVLVFGKDKLHALQVMFAEGSEEEVPARFFKRPQIAQRT